MSSAARDADGPVDAPSLEFVCTLVAATGPDARERAEAELRRWDREPSPDLVAVGAPDAIAAAIRRRAGQGPDTIVLQPTADEPDLEAFIAFLGREVRPLVAG